MKMKTVTASKNPNKFRAMVTEVLRNRLYVSGWCMSHDLVGARASTDYGGNNMDYPLMVGYNDDPKPIALGFALEYPDETAPYFEVQHFTKKSERRKGFGQKISKRVNKIVKGRRFIFGCGVRGSLNFFNKMYFKKLNESKK